MPLKNSNPAHCRVVPSGAEIDKPLPQREPSSSISPLPISLLPLSAAVNLPRLVILQTALLWNKESHSAWSEAHGVTTFFFPEMELTVEALNGHERVLYRGLHGNPELVPPLPEFPEDQATFLIQEDKKRSWVRRTSSLFPSQQYNQPQSGE